MDKQDHDAILKAYNVARERLAKRQSDSGQVDDEHGQRPQGAGSSERSARLHTC